VRPASSVVAAVVLVAVTAGCGAGSDPGAGTGSGDDRTTLTVYAAASLTSAFEQIGASFEQSHEGVEVALNFAGSSDLVSQIRSGAPADVFASADEANMDKLTSDGLNGSDPEPFATNTLQIATPPDNPAGVRSFQDLAESDLELVVCAPEVPCGAAAQAVAQLAGVVLEPVSEEQSVSDVLAKVTSGEADAGLVYVTDVLAAGDDVEGIAFPESKAVVNRYPIATVEDSENADLAQEFVDAVLGDEGQRVLADAGFGGP
jgi:molybdate transport system substrate-binding protein